MARPIRVEFAGAVYHVMARGNERRPVFRDDEDRRRFLETLGEMTEQFGVAVHAYCLMANHYHLLVETPRANLSRAMGWLQTTYTVRFNRRHRRSGHLFQGRFKAQVIEVDEYAQWLVEYIHLNPVRPRRKGERIARERAQELDGYAWSSHRDYAGLRHKTAGWLCRDWLRYWGRTEREAQAGYRQRIRQAFESGTIENPWERLQGGLVLGGEALWKKAQSLLGRKPGQEDVRWFGRQRRQHARVQWEQRLAQEPDKRVRIWVRVRLAGERKVDVARDFGYRDGGSVLQVIKRLEAARRRDRALNKRLTELENFAALSSVER
ncbi:MAG TPA: transposase [Verrucomicrobiae bacterium]|nr:transposase [Verrucomicrobiae bacterium]